MTIRKILAALMALTLVLTFAACDNSDNTPITTAAPTEPPITAEYLYRQLAVAAAETPITGADVEGEQEMTMTFSSIGTSITTSMGTMGTMRYSPELGICYSELTEGVSVYGELTTEKTVNYTLEEDGVKVTYAYNESTELWTRQESSQVMSDFCAGALTPDSLTLDESTQTVSGKEVYVLHAQFSGNVLKDSFASVSSLLETMDFDSGDIELDMSGIRASVTYYIDTETLLLVQIDSSMDGIGEAITDLVVEYALTTLEEAKEELGSEYASIVKMYKQLSITTPLYTQSYLNISYDPVTVPELPEEAPAAAALIEYDPLQADGSYVLKQIGATVTIVPPTGWTIAENDHHMVIAIAPDEFNELHYWLMDDVSEQDILDGFETSADTYKEYDAYISHGLGDVVDGWQTATITCDAQTHVYLAWKQVSDHNWIWVEYHDYRNASMSDTLLPQLKSVSVGK